MSDTLNQMRRKKDACTKIQKVVRIMKLIAASQVKDCQRAAQASENYYSNIKTALSAFFKKLGKIVEQKRALTAPPLTVAIIFGTDQGLVGPFNDILARFVATSLKGNEEKKVFVIGQRMGGILEKQGVRVDHLYPMPRSVKEIPSTIHELMLDMKLLVDFERRHTFFLFHNRTVPGELLEPVSTKVLPLDEVWQTELKQTSWPTHMIPEILETDDMALLHLLREYLFAAFARSLAESIECENLVRFLSMQKAEDSINETVSDLTVNINIERQSVIDAELFDVISDFSTLSEGS
jgi:F-type H+-transporting ATPase subunit gamma